MHNTGLFKINENIALVYIYYRHHNIFTKVSGRKLCEMINLLQELLCLFE